MVSCLSVLEGRLAMPTGAQAVAHLSLDNSFLVPSEAPVNSPL